mmetsp:Transcript_31601/g.103000  ORF Transcript_31601/g.103000 Transcript_31601/m.103000 type:complete len:227 (+) Transcript_31601:61-741(+)
MVDVSQKRGKGSTFLIQAWNVHELDVEDDVRSRRNPRAARSGGEPFREGERAGDVEAADASAAHREQAFIEAGDDVRRLRVARHAHVHRRVLLERVREHLAVLVHRDVVHHALEPSLSLRPVTHHEVLVLQPRRRRRHCQLPETAQTRLVTQRSLRVDLLRGHDRGGAAGAHCGRHGSGAGREDGRPARAHRRGRIRRRLRAHGQHSASCTAAARPSNARRREPGR